MARRHTSVLFLLAVLAAGCHRPRPATPPPEPERPAPRPSPPAEAGGHAAAGAFPEAPADSDEPLASWYEKHSAEVPLNPAAPPESLSVGIHLLDWIARRDEAAWERMAPRVEQAFREPGRRLELPFTRAERERAARYHQVAAAGSALPRGERDADREERIYGKSLLLDPTDPDLINHLAIVHNLRKQHDVAVRFAMLAIAVDPGFLSSYQELAYAYKNLGRYEDAIAVAERGLKVDGDLHIKALLLARQGQAYWMLRKEQDALHAFGKSKRLGGPGWVESYLNGEQKLGEEFQVRQP